MTTMVDGEEARSSGTKVEDAFRETDADSAADGPKVLMPPKEFLGVNMPSEADSFSGYLAGVPGSVRAAGTRCVRVGERSVCAAGVSRVM